MPWVGPKDAWSLAMIFSGGFEKLACCKVAEVLKTFASEQEATPTKTQLRTLNRIRETE